MNADGEAEGMIRHANSRPLSAFTCVPHCLSASRVASSAQKKGLRAAARRSARRGQSAIRDPQSAIIKNAVPPPRRTAASGPVRQNSSSQATLRHTLQARLWLLPSGPDQVHGAALQRTQLSSPSAGRVCLLRTALGGEISPAVADCGSTRRLQGTASAPPWHGKSHDSRPAPPRQGAIGKKPSRGRQAKKKAALEGGFSHHNGWSLYQKASRPQVQRFRFFLRLTST